MSETLTERLPRFSIIIPVRNEAKALSRCLESLLKVDYPQEHVEIIVADGLSYDNTQDVTLRYGAKVVINDRQLVASGRNSGFEKATGDIIAFTDADCVFDPGWLKNSLKYFQNKKVAGVGGVTLMPEDSSSFEKAVAFLFSLAESLQATSHLQNITETKEIKDIPGCCAMYRKDVLNEVMPVDENLITAEDVWMNFCIKKLGYTFLLAPDVILRHYRRNSIRKFFRQMYRFAIGRVQVGRKNRELLNGLHIFAGLSLPLITFIGAIFFILVSKLFILGICLVFFIGTFLLGLIRTGSIKVAANLPLVLILFICAWSIGFMREYFYPGKTGETNKK